MKKIVFYFKNFLTKNFFPFYKRKDIKDLFKILEKGREDNNEKEVAMFVGGCVRNFIKSEIIQDIDIATIFSPEELKEKLRNSKFKVIDTGIEHGSVTIISDKNKFEITTLRKDVETDGRHAEIQITDNWKEDSNRRDFTINAIYMSKKGEIYDPQQGVNDLNNNIIKFIGDPQRRIEEDFLRILRYLRFSIKYESNIEKSTIQAINLNISGIKNLSKERIITELFKILELNSFFKIVNNNEQLNIFKLIFPEFKNLIRLKNFNLINNYLKKDKILFLCILLIDETNNFEYFFHKYNISNKIKDNLILINTAYKNSKENKDFFKNDIKNNLYKYNKKNIEILYAINLLNKKKISKIDLNFFKELSKITIPKFPIDGKSLINRGMKEGKNFGLILKEAEKFWLKNNFNISSKDLETIVNKYPK